MTAVPGRVMKAVSASNAACEPPPVADAHITQVVAERGFCKRIDAQHAQGAIADFQNADRRLDDRSSVTDAQIDAHRPIDVAGQTGDATDHLVCGATGHAFGAKREGAPGTVVGEIDGDDHRDANGNTDYHQRTGEQATFDRSSDQPHQDAYTTDHRLSLPPRLSWRRVRRRVYNLTISTRC